MIRQLTFPLFFLLVGMRSSAMTAFVSGWTSPPPSVASKIVPSSSRFRNSKAVSYNNEIKVSKTHLFMSFVPPSDTPPTTPSNEEQQQEVIPSSPLNNSLFQIFALMILPSYLLFLYEIPYAALSNLASASSSSKLLYDAAYTSVSLSPLISALLFSAIVSSLFSLKSSMFGDSTTSALNDDLSTMTPLTASETRAIMSVVDEQQSSLALNSTLGDSLRGELEQVQKLVNWAEYED